MLIKLKQEKFRLERKQQRLFADINKKAYAKKEELERQGASVVLIAEDVHHPTESSYKQMLKKILSKIEATKKENKVPILIKKMDYISNDDILSYELNVDEEGWCRLPSGEFADDEFIFVRLMDGRTYMTNDLSKHHSYIANGKKVQAAGKLHFLSGRLYLVSNESGHYTPTNEEMLEQIKYYYDLAKNDGLVYEDHSNIPVNKTVYRYEAKDIYLLDHWVPPKPIEVVKDKSSNFGRELKSTFIPPIEPNFDLIKYESESESESVNLNEKISTNVVEIKKLKNSMERDLPSNNDYDEEIIVNSGSLSRSENNYLDENLNYHQNDEGLVKSSLLATFGLHASGYHSSDEELVKGSSTYALDDEQLHLDRFCSY